MGVVFEGVWIDICFFGGLVVLDIEFCWLFVVERFVKCFDSCLFIKFGFFEFGLV